MFKKSKANNFYLYSTSVDNLFISDFMREAPGEYVKAYLLGLMYAELGQPLDNDGLCDQLGLDRKELERCWEYWEGVHAIKRVTNKLDKDGKYDIEFVNLKELAFGGDIKDAREESELDNKALAKLYQDVQAVTGRLIAETEMQTIASWISDYEISPEVILLCYSYCAANRKTSACKYVAAVLKDWKSKGLNTAEQVNDYLDDYDARFADFKLIFKELGFHRTPTAEEKRIMSSWFTKGKSLNEILNACKQTIGISNPNIKYVDAVLNKATEKIGEGTENLANKISAIYESIRIANDKQTKENRASVFKKIPAMQDILKEVKAETIKQTEAMIKRDALALEQARNKISELLVKKDELLKQNGFKPDALNTIYTCKECKDTGIREDGTVCSCYAKHLEELNVKAK